VSERTSNRETEIKLGAWPGFEVPGLDGALDGVVATPGPELELDATYFDTRDLRLIRSGVTVRHRRGDDPPWTVKLPDADAEIDEAALVRLELGFPGTIDAVPEEVSALVRAYRRTAPLEPVARLATKRRRLEVRDQDGTRLAEIDDDEVSVLDTGRDDDRLLARFREVEVELSDGASSALLDAIVDRLREAGAGAPDPTPKVVRALGPRALAPPDVVAVDVGDEASAGDIFRAGVAAAALRVVHHDPIVRLDAGLEGVHQMRVGARRLRSDLRTFSDLLSGDWGEPLREELAWLAGLLGPVRDGDVLAKRLVEQGEDLPSSDRPSLRAILNRLRRERDEALEAAVRELGGDRYGQLIDTLVGAAQAPELSRLAAKPAADVIPALVGKAWQRLSKAVDALGDDPASPAQGATRALDDRLHKVRILAKRARYAADVAVPVVGKPARQLSSHLGDLQDALGIHQDGAVAEAWLRGIVPSLNKPQAVVAGQLIAMQRASAGGTRSSWVDVWKQASHKKATAWLP
jgi:CHAD domain-containing protein